MQLLNNSGCLSPLLGIFASKVVPGDQNYCKSDYGDDIYDLLYPPLHFVKSSALFISGGLHTYLRITPSEFISYFPEESCKKILYTIDNCGYYANDGPIGGMSSITK